MGETDMPFKCPRCGTENPRLYAESGIEICHFQIVKGEYKLTCREIQPIKPAMVFCSECEAQLIDDETPALNFAENP